jgi:hypothetical protein
MEHTEVAGIDYLPGTWPKHAGIACIARRTRIPVELIPSDGRARKLRTIDKGQLALALEGKLDHVYGFVHPDQSGRVDTGQAGAENLVSRGGCARVSPGLILLRRRAPSLCGWL